MMTDQAPIDPLISELLRDSDQHCRTCGYALRGCTTARCPECGVALRAVVESSDQRSGWWFAAVFGCIVSACLWTVMVIPKLLTVTAPMGDRLLSQMVNFGVASAPTPPTLASIAFLLGNALLALAALAWLLGARRRLLCWPLPMRVVVAVVGLLLPLLQAAITYQVTERGWL